MAARSSASGMQATPLTPDMTGMQAFLHLVRQQAAAHDAQRKPILKSDAPEGVHRARVALRRLRSVVAGFSDMLSPGARDRLQRRLGERFRALGPLRDADVHAEALLDSRGGDKAARHAARLRDALRAEIEDGTWRPLAAELAPLLKRSKLSSGGRRQRLAAAPVPVVASRALQVAWTEMLAFGEHLDRLAPDDLHGFRKRAKEMRYLAEFFGPLWPGEPQVRMVRRMARMQDALGVLNDLTTMRMNARDGIIAHLPPDAEAREHQARDAADAAWARLREAEPWWCAMPPAQEAALPDP